MLSSPLIELSRRSESDGHRTFMVDGRTSLTFAEAYQGTLALASRLSAMGVGKGDRVGVLMSRSYKQALAQLGAMAADAVMVPISDLLKPAQVRHVLDNCGARAVIVDSDKLDRLGSSAAGMAVLVSNGAGQGHSTVESVLEGGLVNVEPSIIGSDSAAIIYTSGSTGLPKGIVLTHRNLWDGARIVSAYLGHGPDDRLAQILSLNFDYGLNQLLGAIHVGAELHFSTFHFPKDVFAFLRERRITTLALMPVFLNRLFEPLFYKPEFAEGMTSLRRITTTGGRMPARTIDAIKEAFPETDLYLMYGLTEAFRSTYLSPDQVGVRPLSIGKAIPDAEILVLDEAGEECAPNVSGELVHRGGVIAKGYWNEPESTAERFRFLPDPSGNPERVVYSGDIVRRDEEGFLFFVGRADNMIKTSGQRVSPEEIERAAEQLDGIEHAVAFGREHDVLGEEIVLVCISNDGDTPPEKHEIKRSLNERLASYMVPHQIVFQTGFEVTPGNQGKVDRAGAKAYALELLGGE